MNGYIYQKERNPNINETLINAFNEYRDSTEYDLMKYKLAVDAMNITLWDMDVVVSDPINPCNRLVWSQEFRDMLGFTDENDFPNRLQSWIDRLHPEDRDMALNALLAHIRDRTGKTPYDIEYRLMLKNGYYRSFHSLGATHRDKSGIPFRVAGAMMDITEKKQMTKSLKHRDLMLSAGIRAAEILLSADDEASIEAALTASLELVGVSTDVDRVHIWRNEKIDGLLHFVPVNEWMSGNGKLSARVPEGSKFAYRDRPGWESTFLKRKCINGPLSEMQQEDQLFLSAFDVKSIVIIPLFLHDRFWGFVSFIDCRIERTLPEDEINILRWVSLMIASAVNRGEHIASLREAHERTRLLLDAMPLVCHLWNRDNMIFDCNEENTRLFDLEDKNDIKDNFFRFSPEYQPDGRLTSEKALECIKKAFDEGKYVINWMHQLLDGTPIPCDMTLVRVNDGDSCIIAAYAQDMRKHKTMMAETHRLHGELKAALKEAHQANQAKSNFLASMSHEMRTPLNAVVGLSELLINTGAVHGETEEKLDKIHTSGMTLLGIVNDILDISKIESGKFEMHPIEYDTPSLINDIVSQNIMRLADKPIKFTLSVDDMLPERVYGDDLRIKQVFNNLLSNAFKYTHKGVVEWLVTYEIDGDSIWIVSEVKDTGIGIKQEDMHKLFANYSQVDADTNRKTEGTGLGLSITKRLVEMMDGSVTFNSIYGEGSTFGVRMRQKFISDVPIGAKTAESLMSTSYSSVKRSRGASLVRIDMSYAHVLVVDDVITNLDVIKGMLRPYGIKVDCAMNGLRAIEMACAPEAHYDAIFMDHMMPDMDGIEAARIIRDEMEAGRTKKMPIIALTANAIVGNEQIFLDNGFQAFISKPIDIMRLDSILRQWIRDKKRETAPEGADMPVKAERTHEDMITIQIDSGAGGAGSVGSVGSAGGAGSAGGVGSSGGTVSVGSAGSVGGAGSAGDSGSTGNVGGAGSTGSTFSASSTVGEVSADESFIYTFANVDIDVKTGMQRFSGNIDLYIEVLQSFFDNTRVIIGDMQKYLADGNMRKYAIAAHGVKGSCYGIGAIQAGNEAEELEQLANADKIEIVARDNSVFVAHIDNLLASIAIILKEFKAYRSKPLADAPDAALLEELCEACENYDIDKIDEIMPQLDAYEYREGDDILHWLHEQLNDLNYATVAEGGWLAGIKRIKMQV